MMPFYDKDKVSIDKRSAEGTERFSSELIISFSFFTLSGILTRTCILWLAGANNVTDFSSKRPQGKS